MECESVDDTCASMPGSVTTTVSRREGARLTSQSTQPPEPLDERLAIVGSGAIACGLAATAAHHGPVLLLARSQDSAERASATVERTLNRLGAEVDPEHIEIVTDPQALAPATFVVEAVVEDHEIKAGLL